MKKNKTTELNKKNLRLFFEEGKRMYVILI